jgi:hypothetical protein
MSFRVCSGGLCDGAGEKSFRTCMAVNILPANPHSNAVSSEYLLGFIPSARLYPPYTS